MLTVPEGFTQILESRLYSRWALQCEECGWTTTPYFSGNDAFARREAREHDLAHLKAAALRGARW